MQEITATKTTATTTKWNIKTTKKFSCKHKINTITSNDGTFSIAIMVMNVNAILLALNYYFL